MAQNNQNSDHKKWHQKWWGIIILVILAILFVLLIAYLYLIIFYIEENKNQAEQGNLATQSVNPAELEAATRAIIETADDPAIGAPGAQIVVVEFSDFQCPYCLQAYPIVKQIINEYQDEIKFIYRDMPNLSGHPQALSAAIAAECAAEQDKFWQYHDQLFAQQNDLSVTNLKNIALQLNLEMISFNDCLDKNKYQAEVLNDLDEGMRLGVDATPTFFINGVKISDVIPYESFKQIIEKLKSNLK